MNSYLDKLQNEKVELERKAQRVMFIGNKLENFCKGYPLENFSVGKTITFIAENQNFGLNFNIPDLQILGDIARDKKQQDFKSSFTTLKTLIQDVYGKNIPDLDSKLWFKPQTEYDYLQHIAKIKNITRGNIPPSTAEKIRMIKQNPDNNSIKQKSSHQVNMFVLIPRSIGIPLDLIIVREKTDQSLAIKSIERLKQIYNPNKNEDTYKTLMRYNYNVEILPQLCDVYLRQAILSGTDFQQFYERELHNNAQLFEICGEAVSRRFLIDAAGFKLSGTTEEITRLNRIIADTAKYKAINTQAKNYLKKQIKDLAIVRPCRGIDDGSYIEIRLQPFKESLIRADFGVQEIGENVIAHPEYKATYVKETQAELNNNFDFALKASNICAAMGYNLEQLLDYYLC